MFNTMRGANMRKSLVNIVLIAASCVALFGCKSTDGLSEKQGGATASQDQGISPAEMAAMDAQARGMKNGQQPPHALPLNAAPTAASTQGGQVIYFDYDSDVIRQEYQPIVEASATHLSSHPGSVATLEGHTDERGSREYNLALGERRANAVRKQIATLGAPASQIRTVSYGEERPNNGGHDEAAYGQNRRVEITY
jgi:peptidoglycan-associated lipoprotein